MIPKRQIPDRAKLFGLDLPVFGTFQLSTTPVEFSPFLCQHSQCDHMFNCLNNKLYNYTPGRPTWSVPALKQNPTSYTQESWKSHLVPLLL